jgi:hypothetical protein
MTSILASDNKTPTLSSNKISIFIFLVIKVDEHANMSKILFRTAYVDSILVKNFYL